MSELAGSIQRLECQLMSASQVAQRQETTKDKLLLTKAKQPSEMGRDEVVHGGADEFAPPGECRGRKQLHARRPAMTTWTCSAVKSSHLNRFQPCSDSSKHGQLSGSNSQRPLANCDGSRHTGFATHALMANVWDYIFGSSVRCENTAPFLAAVVRSTILVDGLLHTVLVPIYANGSCARNDSPTIHVHAAAAGKDVDAGVRPWVLGPSHENESAYCALSVASSASEEPSRRVAEENTGIQAVSRWVGAAGIVGCGSCHGSCSDVFHGPFQHRLHCQNIKTYGSVHGIHARSPARGCVPRLSSGI